MQKIFYFISIVILLACNQKSQQRYLQLSGNIKNAASNKLFLLYIDPEGKVPPQVLDTIILTKNSFESKKIAVRDESMYVLQLEGSNNFIRIINDVEKITIDADMNIQDKYATNSPATNRMLLFMDSVVAINRAIVALQPNDSVFAALPTSVRDSITIVSKQRIKQKEKERMAYITQTAQNDKSAVLTFLALNVMSQYAEPEMIAPVMDSAAKRFVDNKMINSLNLIFQKQYDGYKSEKQAADSLSGVGKQAPELYMPDINGKNFSLKNLRGKYVLIDFWASWCAPCRAENPNVVQAFQTFKNKNFTVLGVSLDKTKEEWQQAIKKDRLTWYHISDIKYWDSDAVKLYGFKAIPYNVLIDTSGKIIANNLRGDKLFEKLKEVLK